ncbi:MAG: TlpA family protein disulfide reductase [Bacteroidales bacterium]|nr:TlpA family protein disulfide reductase [Bacteroidales bacterium]
MYKLLFLSLITISFTMVQPESTGAQTMKETGLQIGNILPDITLNDVNGKPLSISELRGNIVFVDFWASWCSPCRRENPAVVETFNTFKGQKYKDATGFKIFSISLDNSRSDWIKAIETDGLIWPEHVSDLQGWRSVAAKKYGVRAIPMNYLIDQNGIIIAKNLRGHQLADMLKNLIQN